MLTGCRLGEIVSLGLFSAFVNLLMLTGPLFMLQIYDRVLTSRSEATLVASIAIVAFLFLMMGLLDHAPAPRAGASRGALPGAPRWPGAGGDAEPGRALARLALGAGARAARPGGDAALRLGSGAVRVLRRAVDAGVPARAVHLPLAAGGAGGVLGRAAAGAG